MHAFHQQLRAPRPHVRSLSAMFSMFSSQFPSTTRRGVLSVSDMSSKNCDRMESIWDIGPMIWRIKTRRRPCRRRSLKGFLKSAPFLNFSRDLQHITSIEQIQRNLLWNLESSWPCSTFGDKLFLSLLELSWPFAGDGDGNVDALLHELT